MDKHSIVWIGCRTLGCLVPQGGCDDPAVHNGEQVVQDLGMQLEAGFVKAICTMRRSKVADVMSQERPFRPETWAASWPVRNSRSSHMCVWRGGGYRHEFVNQLHQIL